MAPDQQTYGFRWKLGLAFTALCISPFAITAEILFRLGVICPLQRRVR